MQFWIRRLLKNLARHPIVADVQLRSNRISVTYTTGFKRNYVFGQRKRRHIYMTNITQKDTITEFIKIGYEFQWKLLNRPDLEKYFLIKRERLDRASYLEIEILVQELLAKLMEHRCIPNHYTNDDLLTDLERIKTMNRTFYNGMFTIHPPPDKLRGYIKPGKTWVETYYDIDIMAGIPGYYGSTMEAAFENDKFLYVILQQVIRESKSDITISSIRHRFARKNIGPRYLNPITYKVLFNQLLNPVNRVITDHNPHLGVKGIATAVVGGIYNPLGYFPDAMATDLGLRLKRDNKGPFDILLYDNNFKRVDIDEAMKWHDRCNEMLLYVESDQLNWARIKYKPKQIIKVKTKMVAPKGFTPNFLFHFKRDKHKTGVN